ncbi:MAG: stage IV sporulation protein A, partial [Oscillospiraceae bacterium]|nr:stage IV sporulation protein A [Oscillospiraceae bacterium]
MEKIYEDIARRTGGDIYVGVVGPVRSGKSTFIKRFMEILVIPNIENTMWRERARDELPQSGSGRTIMTAEPKFVPEDAVEITVGESANFSVRMIDSVGYMVESAIGQFEDGRPRMVNTPWLEHEIPMTEAAEMGTRKVIAEHSTIGIVLTTDGSITDIPREDYIEPEERVINELKALGKPFVIVVNSMYPDSPMAKTVCDDLAAKHGVSASTVNCSMLEESDILELLKTILYEFPVTELGLNLPPWVETLPFEHPIKSTLFECMRASGAGMRRIGDIDGVIAALRECPHISGIRTDHISLGTGEALATIELPRELFYKTLGEQSGFEIGDDGDLMKLL